MKTYFIRHTEKLNISEDTLNSLIENNLIAIHYPFMLHSNEPVDSTSTNPDDYKHRNAKSALRTLNKLSIEGGYVCSEYRNRQGAILGIVNPNTPIEIFKGRSRTHGNREAILKALRIVKSKHIDAGEYLKISYARPIQGTICYWRKAGKRIEHLVNQTCIEPILNHLSPTHQEVLCSEYLRSGMDSFLPKIQSFLLPVGRTLKDIDILGINDLGQKIYCQVTYKCFEQATLKLEKLKNYLSNNSYAVLFCTTSQNIVTPDGVIVYSIKTAFDNFVKTAQGQLWSKNIFDYLVYKKEQMGKMVSIFNKSFSGSEIAIPPEDAHLRKRGKIIKSGWTIWYLFGRDENGEYLDYYASHRMTDDSHVRIYDNGKTLCLPSIASFFVTSENLQRAAELQAQYYEKNKKIQEILCAKGFCLDGNEPISIAINRKLACDELNNNRRP